MRIRTGSLVAAVLVVLALMPAAGANSDHHFIEGDTTSFDSGTFDGELGSKGKLRVDGIAGTGTLRCMNAACVDAGMSYTPTMHSFDLRLKLKPGDSPTTFAAKGRVEGVHTLADGSMVSFKFKVSGFANCHESGEACSFVVGDGRSFLDGGVRRTATGELTDVWLDYGFAG